MPGLPAKVYAPAGKGAVSSELPSPGQGVAPGVRGLAEAGHPPAFEGGRGPGGAVLDGEAGWAEQASRASSQAPCTPIMNPRRPRVGTVNC